MEKTITREELREQWKAKLDVFLVDNPGATNGEFMVYVHKTYAEVMEERA